MRGNLAVIAAVIVLAFLAVAAYYYLSKPVPVSSEPLQVSEAEINALGQYQPIEINAPIDENVDIPAVSAEDVSVELPESI